MQVEHLSELSSTELALIWTTYIENSLSLQVLTYFKTVNKDPDIAPIITKSLKLSQETIDQLAELFHNESIPVPAGFTEKDLYPNAPRLYSDMFAQRYMKHMTKMGMSTYAMATAVAARKDVSSLFQKNLKETMKLHNENTEIMLEKGIYIRPPILTKPDKVEFITKQSFMEGLVGRKRPLTAVEISHMSLNIENNLVGSTLLTGFAQVAQNPKVRDYMVRGKQIALKHAEVFRKHLVDDEISSPSVWDSTVERSITPPFSDKLMIYHTNALNAFGVGNYGLAIAACLRNDLAVDYTRLMAEVLKYAEDGTNIMIDEGWLEQPPQATDFRALTYH